MVAQDRSVIKDFLITAFKICKTSIIHDAIISVGYRLNSIKATISIWATKIIRYIVQVLLLINLVLRKLRLFKAVQDVLASEDSAVDTEAFWN